MQHAPGCAGLDLPRPAPAETFRRDPSMLHALLHGKLDESTSEPDRLEDALTSTILGTLLLVDATTVLRDWLPPEQGASHKVGMDPPPAVLEGWFWPRLPFAEPDCLIRIGARLFVIEAKYRSGKSGYSLQSVDAETPARDQLQSQYRSICHIAQTGVGLHPQSRPRSDTALGRLYTLWMVAGFLRLAASGKSLSPSYRMPTSDSSPGNRSIRYSRP
ncbi:MAG: hypothetical protein IPJ41_04395 [Phycisphaerales bacterium]|nr:hypothetical protein [Phycisphaerales bacterium]